MAPAASGRQSARETGSNSSIVGGEGSSARRVREVAQKIADATACEVELWDERLTTVEARRRLAEANVHGRKARGRVDSSAATVILQAWLDGRGSKS